MDQFKILSALDTDCPFPEVFTEIENPDELVPQYRRKIVYLRADYDGWRWWNTCWPAHMELATPENSREIDAVYEALTADDALKNLDALRGFCRKHPEAAVNTSSRDEFNFYLEGALCWYWLRLITRRGDYNLYLHAFLKEADPAAQRCFDILDGLSEPGCEELQKACPELTEEDASAMFRRWERRFRRPDSETKEDAPCE